jgi:site-specific recombinase XerD
VSFAKAREAFSKHLISIARNRPTNGPVVVGTLFDQYLDALLEHRSERTYIERKLHLNRFANFARGTTILGKLPAIQMEANDLLQFMEECKRERDLDPLTVHKHVTSIIAAFHWGAGLARLKNPAPCLPQGFRPFANVERYKAPPNELDAEELPTQEEIDALFQWADTDVEQIYENGRWRSRRPDERRTGHDNPYAGFGDMLKVYHATGARTSELAACSVSDCNHRLKQILLKQHKRSRTLRDATSRCIALNAEAYAIVAALCQNKRPTDPIFTDPKGRRWTRHRLVVRFKQVRKLAGVRDQITIYSFRHLWISEALMSQLDIATVAKMAGTSVAMVERVYGHYSSQHFADSLRKLDAAREQRRTTGATQ